MSLSGPLLFTATQDLGVPVGCLLLPLPSGVLQILLLSLAPKPHTKAFSFSRGISPFFTLQIPTPPNSEHTDTALGRSLFYMIYVCMSYISQ